MQVLEIISSAWQWPVPPDIFIQFYDGPVFLGTRESLVKLLTSLSRDILISAPQGLRTHVTQSAFVINPAICFTCIIQNANTFHENIHAIYDNKSSIMRACLSLVSMWRLHTFHLHWPPIHLMLSFVELFCPFYQPLETEYFLKMEILGTNGHWIVICFLLATDLSQSFVSWSEKNIARSHLLFWMVSCTRCSP